MLEKVDFWARKSNMIADSWRTKLSSRNKFFPIQLRRRNLFFGGIRIKMTTTIFFLIALSFLIVHEMDAVRRQEWTIFPFLSRFDEETGYIVFTAAHIPLVFLIVLGLANGGIIASTIRFVLDGFFMIHIGLHIWFRRHPKNQFTSRFTWVLIAGAGLFGLADIFACFFPG